MKRNNGNGTCNEKCNTGITNKPMGCRTNPWDNIYGLTLKNTKIIFRDRPDTQGNSVKHDDGLKPVDISMGCRHKHIFRIPTASLMFGISNEKTF